MDLYRVLQKIAIPRPNHSEALDQVAAYIKGLLASWDMPFTVQEFSLRAHALHVVAVACLLCGLLVLFFVLKRKPLAALLFALAIPAILILEFELWIPTVSALISKTGQNFIIKFNAPGAVRDLVFNAHYDSKTDYWDHAQRYWLYRWLTLFFVLGVLLAAWAFLAKRFKAWARPVSRYIALSLAVVYVIYWCLLAFGFTGHILLSRDEQSYGAVDNGASVVILLALAKDIRDGRVKIGKSNVTILLGSGEEVGLQGAFAFVKEYLKSPRESTVPVYVVDLDSIGDSGNLLYPTRVGSRFKYYDVSPELVKRVGEAWMRVSGKAISSEDKSYACDAMAFAKAGFPTIELGNTGSPEVGTRGLHTARDNLDRVSINNMKLSVRMLGRFIQGFN